MFTPNGLSVSAWQRSISARSASGLGWVSAVRMPSAPALDTALASSAVPTPCIPPCTIGCSIPSISVILVRNAMPSCPPVSARCVRPCRAGAQPIVGMTKAFDPSKPPSGQRAVTFFTRVQKRIPSSPYWSVSPKPERFHPPNEW